MVDTCVSGDGAPSNAEPGRIADRLSAGSFRLWSTLALDQMGLGVGGVAMVALVAALLPQGKGGWHALTYVSVC